MRQYLLSLINIGSRWISIPVCSVLAYVGYKYAFIGIIAGISLATHVSSTLNATVLFATFSALYTGIYMYLIFRYADRLGARQSDTLQRSIASAIFVGNPICIALSYSLIHRVTGIAPQLDMLQIALTAFTVFMLTVFTQTHPDKRFFMGSVVLLTTVTLGLQTSLVVDAAASPTPLSMNAAANSLYAMQLHRIATATRMINHASPQTQIFAAAICILITFLLANLYADQVNQRRSPAARKSFYWADIYEAQKRSTQPQVESDEAEAEILARRFTRNTVKTRFLRSFSEALVRQPFEQM